MKRTKTLIIRKYGEYFVPTVLTAMATNFAAIVDACIVGNLIDSTALSVINILMPVVQFYAAVSILFGIAASAIIAGSRGKDGNDFTTGNLTLSVTVISLLGIAAVMMVLQFVFMDEIVAFLTPVREIRPQVRDYYLPFICGTPITLLTSSFVHVVRTDSRPKYATAIVFVTNGVNLALDVALIKFCGMGLLGASLATVIGSVAGLTMILCHFKSPMSTVHWDSFVLRRPKRFFGFLLSELAAGASGAMGVMLTTAKLLFLNLLVQHYGGKAGMVSFSAVSFCQVVESAFVSGGCQAMVPLVSLLNGEKDRRGVEYAFRAALLILAVSCLVITVIMELFPGSAAAIYGITGEQLIDTVAAIRVSMLMLLGDAIVYLFIYFYMCVGRKLLSIVFSVLNGIVFVLPFGLILGKTFGIDGVWWSLSAAQYAALLTLLLTALIIKKVQHCESITLLDDSEDKDILAFSVSPNGIDLASVRKEVASKAGETVADAACDILMILDRAKTAPRRKKNADVRILSGGTCSVIVKSGGALVSETDIAELSEKHGGLRYSESMGFRYIILLDEINGSKEKSHAIYRS